MDKDTIRHYFPAISESTLQLFERLGPLYKDWNSKVNLVSRTDIENLYERHVLHSLAIAKFIRFKNDTHVLDIGTGGGFPGIPLSIMFPEVHFTLVDSIGKKIRVVDDVIKQLELTNASAVCERAEKINGSFDYVVSRATAPLSDLYKWSRTQIVKTQRNAIPNGIICLKGGDLSEELNPFKGRTEVVPLSDYFKEDFFETKQLVFLAV
jgi:16S rRNA (guanine527-N7)-methyltransferase